MSLPADSEDSTERFNGLSSICFSQVKIKTPQDIVQQSVPHLLQDVEAVLESGVFLPQLFQAWRWTEVLGVFKIFDLCRQTLDLLLLDIKIFPISKKDTEKESSNWSCSRSFNALL